MAHFAKIENGVVVEVVVVANEHEANGEAFLNGIGLTGKWIQTSYNGKIRGKFAAIGDTYDETVDAFFPPKRFASWIWNAENYSWEAPVKHPVLIDPSDDTIYKWNEKAAKWEVTDTHE